MTRLPRPAARPQAGCDPADYPWTPLRENTLLAATAAWPMSYRADADEDDVEARLGTAWTVDRGEGEGEGETSLDAALAALGVPGLAERRPVLAIGSNRSAAALRRKFGTDTSWAIPVLCADVEGVYVGYAACVSTPGWIPWAPMRVTCDNRFHAWPVLLLTESELAILDASEPNYRRLPLDTECRVFVDSGPLSEAFADPVELYRSRHGLIADADGIPVHAQDQGVGLALVEQALGRIVDDQLADDPDLRDAARLALAEHAVDDGFDSGGYDSCEVIGHAATVESREALAAYDAQEAARLAARTWHARLVDDLSATAKRVHYRLVWGAVRLADTSVNRLQHTLRTRIDLTGPVNRPRIEELCRDQLSPLLQDGHEHLPGAKTVWNPFPDRLADLHAYLTWLRYSGGAGWELVGEPGAETVDRHPARMTVYLTTSYHPGRRRADAVQRLHARVALAAVDALTGTRMQHRFTQRILVRRLGRGYRDRPLPTRAARHLDLDAVTERAAGAAATQTLLDDLFDMAPTTSTSEASSDA